MQKSMEALQEDLQAIGQAAYQQPGGQPGAAGPQQGQAPEGNGNGKDEDVVEGEFREA
jgi:hypothetical protein